MGNLFGNIKVVGYVKINITSPVPTTTGAKIYNLLIEQVNNTTDAIPITGKPLYGCEFSFDIDDRLVVFTNGRIGPSYNILYEVYRFTKPDEINRIFYDAKSLTGNYVYNPNYDQDNPDDLRLVVGVLVVNNTPNTVSLFNGVIFTENILPGASYRTAFTMNSFVI